MDVPSLGQEHQFCPEFLVCFFVAMQAHVVFEYHKMCFENVDKNVYIFPYVWLTKPLLVWMLLFNVQIIDTLRCDSICLSRLVSMGSYYVYFFHKY